MPNFRNCRFICCVVNKECCGCCIMGRSGCGLDLPVWSVVMEPGLKIGAFGPGSAWWPRHQTGGNKAQRKRPLSRPCSV